MASLCGGFCAEIRFGGVPGGIGETMFTWESRDVSGWKTAKRLRKRRAMRREPTETNTFEFRVQCSAMCWRTLVARFGGAKRDYLLVEHRFAVRGLGGGRGGAESSELVFLRRWIAAPACFCDSAIPRSRVADRCRLVVGGMA